MLQSPFFDDRETQGPEAREADLFAQLPKALLAAVRADGYARHLAGIDLSVVDSRQALAALPVLRKSALPQMQKQHPPFGGLTQVPLGGFSRLYTSPGPIFEGEEPVDDAFGMARALYAAGVRAGDVVLNTFSYHLTPGGFIFDSAARALQCAVIPAGPGNTEQQLELIEAFRPSVYLGVPDFLKILIDAWSREKQEPFPIRRAVVSGAAFPVSLQQEFAAQGVDAYQVYATADIGCIAYETPARDGLVVNEGVIVEIVRPGTGDPLDEGEIGEVLITSLSHLRPLIRFALGDLSMILPGESACGRTNKRLKGWLGRADQTTKIKGMFVRPEQIAEIGKRHPALGRLRLVVSREGEGDVMTLFAEAQEVRAELVAEVSETLQTITKLRGKVEITSPDTLPRDGKVIADERG